MAGGNCSGGDDVKPKSLKQKLLYDLPIKHLGGHISFKLFGRKVTIYGFNAMWLTIQVHTRRWGYVCFRPPTWHPKFKWSFYVSPNATPWAATFAIGAGVGRDDKRRAPMRRVAFGHNFNTEWHYPELCVINDVSPDY